MIKTKIDEITKLENAITEEILDYPCSHDKDFVDNVRKYILLINEYCRECDERLMEYENYVFKFVDVLGSYKNTKHIMNVYKHLIGCIDEDLNCMACEYNDESDCRCALMKDVAEVFKMFIEVK